MRYLWLVVTLAGCGSYELRNDAPPFKPVQVEAYKMPVPQRTTTNCTRTSANTAECQSETR